MENVLVYIGANIGNSLWQLFDKFDRVFVFEPDPETFEKLSGKYKQFEWVTLVNAACSDSDGEKDLYVTPNRVSSSLSEVNVEDYGGDPAFKTVRVKTINLLNFLKKENVDHIDLYYSDCQGSDYTILSTIKEYLDEQKIDQLYIETHGDGVFLYKGLDNQFSNFKELLSENYDFIHASLGRLDGKIVSESDIPEGEYEWDSLWRIKE
tara:strand:- start:486 stop:1109 length:624 start_codon:yes stop_codon:yes gene_type:complete